MNTLHKNNHAARLTEYSEDVITTMAAYNTLTCQDKLIFLDQYTQDKKKILIFLLQIH